MTADLNEDFGEVLDVDPQRLHDRIAYDRALAITKALQAEYVANGGQLPHPICFFAGKLPHDKHAA